MAEESGFDTEKHFRAEAKKKTSEVVRTLENNDPTTLAAAATSLFTLFGLTPSSDLSVIQENRERWERALSLWKSGASFVDIEMLGEAIPGYPHPVNQYRNIYI